jgi:MFS-type transporter involved in bile tolerance (Atg22 family)
MLRLTSSNHLDLSEMADHKANILISVNSIIISVILGLLFRKLQDEPYLTIPSIMFLVASVSTIVVSILATRPNWVAVRLRRKM